LVEVLVMDSVVLVWALDEVAKGAVMELDWME